MSETAKSVIGRPSSFSDELATEICERLGRGESLRAICRERDMPDISTVCRWLRRKDLDGFRALYTRAREDQADTLAEEIIAIADDASQDYIETEDGPRQNPEVVQRARLRVDARKWFASKLAPRKYGDRQEIEHTGEIVHRHLTLVELQDRLRDARARPGLTVVEPERLPDADGAA